MRYGQSLWEQGLPAQALLQCNRALSCVFDASEPVLTEHPLPYRVLAWMLTNAPQGQFLGNPRRHWQHLATRMVAPHKTLRTWRAWACWYLAKSLLPAADYPADEKQIRSEGVIEPTFHAIASGLRTHSSMNDEAAWMGALREAGVPVPTSPGEVVFEEIRTDGLELVRDLAHRIWPQVYPEIISMEQINYMLSQRYEVEVLAADIRDKGARYVLIRRDGEPVGYIGVEPRPADLFLQKLYLLPEVAGKGIGARALEWVRDEAGSAGKTQVRLVVNKRNANAIRAYLRAGFVFEKEVVTEIGNGFIMDDYQMCLSIR